MTTSQFNYLEHRQLALVLFAVTMARKHNEPVSNATSNPELIRRVCSLILPTNTKVSPIPFPMDSIPCFWLNPVCVDSKM